MDLDVVVCVKNQAENLDRLLRQIVHQVPFENLIVIYGTSTDETQKVAEKYTNKVFWDEDKGLGAARNLGILKASSEIVAMIDSDVILGENWYNQLIENMQDPKTAAAIGTCLFGYGCQPIETYWEFIRHTGENNWACHSTMFRRELVLKVGNFDESIKGAGEDYDLFLRLQKAGYKWVWVREANVYQPTSVARYFKHLNWWIQGTPFMDDVLRQLTTISLSRYYCREMLLVIKSFWVIFRVSFSENPTLMLSYPTMMAAMAYARISGLKKLMSAGYIPRPEGNPR